MKNITTKLVGVIITIHLVLAYITGLDVEPFESSPWYVLMVIPVVVILNIVFSLLDPVFKNYNYHSLNVKLRLSAQNPWVWLLLTLSTLLVIGVVWYAGQSLKPILEISQNITFNQDVRTENILCFAVCSVLYVSCMIWLYKTLKPIWK